MRKLLALLVLVGSVALTQAEEVKLKVEGMVCEEGCVKSVDKALGKLPGVTKKEVKIGTADVTFDASKTSKKDIIAAIEKAGYTVAK